MNWFNNLRLKYKLGVVLLIFTTGLFLFALFSLDTISKIEVNGDLYNEIISGKDLVADILPPPNYIVETHLLCFQMLNEYDQTALNDLISKSRILSKDFETRQNHWQSNLQEGQMKEDMTVNANRPAQDYFEIRDSKFIPLIQSDRREEAKQLLLTEMKDKFDEHRKYIDRVVESANTQNTQLEGSAKELTSSKILSLILLGVGILVITTIIVIFITGKLQNPLTILLQLPKKLRTAM